MSALDHSAAGARGSGSDRWLTALVAAAAAAGGCARELPYARFEPTPPEIVSAMLQLAGIAADDVVYDLGSGDGRIIIAAAKEHGARGVGVELDPQLVERARQAALAAGVADRVSFVRQDLFEADIRPATVVTLYLLPEVNLALRPKLLRELAPGTRIVSHSHDMGEWTPATTQQLRDRRGKLHRIYLWSVPPLADAPPRAAVDRPAP